MIFFLDRRKYFSLKTAAHAKEKWNFAWDGQNVLYAPNIQALKQDESRNPLKQRVERFCSLSMFNLALYDKIIAEF